MLLCVFVCVLFTAVYLCVERTKAESSEDCLRVEKHNYRNATRHFKESIVENKKRLEATKRL